MWLNTVQVTSGTRLSFVLALSAGRKSAWLSAVPDLVWANYFDLLQQQNACSTSLPPISPVFHAFSFHFFMQFFLFSSSFFPYAFFLAYSFCFTCMPFFLSFLLFLLAFLSVFLNSFSDFFLVSARLHVFPYFFPSHFASKLALLLFFLYCCCFLSFMNYKIYNYNTYIDNYTGIMVFSLSSLCSVELVFALIVSRQIFHLF